MRVYSESHGPICLDHITTIHLLWRGEHSCGNFSVSLSRPRMFHKYRWFPHQNCSASDVHHEVALSIQPNSFCARNVESHSINIRPRCQTQIVLNPFFIPVYDHSHAGNNFSRLRAFKMRRVRVPAPRVVSQKVIAFAAELLLPSPYEFPHGAIGSPRPRWYLNDSQFDRSTNSPLTTARTHQHFDSRPCQQRHHSLPSSQVGGSIFGLPDVFLQRDRKRHRRSLAAYCRPCESSAQG